MVRSFSLGRLGKMRRPEKKDKKFIFFGSTGVGEMGGKLFRVQDDGRGFEGKAEGEEKSSGRRKKPESDRNITWLLHGDSAGW